MSKLSVGNIKKTSHLRQGDFMDKVKLYAEQNGYTYWQAKYALEKKRRQEGKEYKPQPKRGWTLQEFDELGLSVNPCDNDYGWEVLRNGKKRAILTVKGTVYKDGGCRYYPAISTTVDNKPKIISLAVLIWVGYLRREIPAGYVVDHIDNDSFNNDTSNLQLLTIRENLLKNPAKGNQYGPFKNSLENQ